MEYKDFKQKCTDIFALNEFLPTPSNEQLDKLWTLTERMLEVNKSLNLTAITDIDAIILKHYADSVTISVLIPEGAALADVGCGAGFPSLPLAIFRPDVKITALDGTAKRIEYVKSTARLLSLENLSAIAGRAEECGNNADFRESFDVVTARAVAALPILTELCLPLVKKDGIFIAMKAAQGEVEATSAANSIRLCGGSPAKLTKLTLTAGGENFEQRNLIIVKKSSPTPQKYPRHYSQITKKPL